MTTTLQDVASVLRSKNAGPFQITIDVMFPDQATYLGVLDAGLITSQEARRLSERADAFRETRLPNGEVLRGSGRAVIFADMLRAVISDVPRAVMASLAMTIVAVLVTVLFVQDLAGEGMRVDLTERSILDDADLDVRWHDDIPVVLIGTALHDRWRVDAARLREDLLAAADLPA